ncbi:MAG: N-6 DNA methylase [Thermodesulfobacteriota bacterium]|nr:N-6 DNA methylase [Thermodesulfobacteriota bacterium]
MKESLKQISDLVERFERNIEAYRSPAYNETQLRREFVDPFFEALGWDVANKAGYAEQYKDVIHEDAIKVSGATKAPDYCFRMGGVRKFFLETKKPSVDIKEQTSPAYQLRRYAWSAKLPISILTDFEELAIYDCRLRPKPSDKPSIGRVRFYTYDRYLDSFEEIYNLLSKESVLKGSFDKFAESERQKRGTTEVDAEFLKEIESWREALAKEIAIRNPKLSVKELNFAVQLTIDRIIFLRMCEDRGIEKYGQIQNLLNGTNTYRRLREIFYHADDKYNSGLFDFKTDRLTPELRLDDKPLKDIFKNLYYPESPYEFSVLGADILGHVYEQFLGKVIRLTEGHRAKVEEKPEVRKAGGVYYTPTYIVDYIVKNTVGKLCDDKTPKQISSLRILDPACGSGSFLLGAYQYLLDYHLNWYPAHHSKKGNVAQGFSPAPKEIYRGRGGQWYLTIQEKKRILLNNIYGVDIDPQAVEVTKLSLLLKVLEGENQDTLERQMKLFKERALPDLGSNIKSGNSLISPDFYQGNLLDSDEIYRINPFDWQKEFPEIMKQGGFDAVIGNPPYVTLGNDLFSDSVLSYLNSYEVAQYKTDLFHLFIQRGIDLLKTDGFLGYITPNTWFTLQFTTKLREYVLKRVQIEELVLFGHLVFQNADVHTGLTFLKKARKSLSHKIIVKNLPASFSSEMLYQSATPSALQTDWLKDPEFRFEIRQTGEVGDLVKRIMRKFPPLERVARASLGIQAYNSSKHTREQIEARVFHALKKLSKEYLPELAGNDVGRYLIDRRKGQWIKYGPWLHDYRTMDWLTGPRILVREIAGNWPYRIHGCYVEETYCNYKTILNVNPSSATDYSMKYLLGILNSRLMSFLYPLVSNKIVVGSFPRLSVRDLKRLPIRTINFSDPTDKARHEKMVGLVEQMLTLHKQLAAAKTPDDKIRLQRQIDTTDHQINRLVYELYGVTEKEIQIVQKGSSY